MRREIINPVVMAASWKRPYSQVEWAWVRALSIEPSKEWQEAERREFKLYKGSSREIRELFRNERHVDLQDRS